MAYPKTLVLSWKVAEASSIKNPDEGKEAHKPNDIPRRLDQI